MLIQILNTIALGIEILGVFLVAYYGFPMTFLEKKIVQWGYDDPDKQKQKSRSWTGTILICSGFVIQIFTNWYN